MEEIDKDVKIDIFVDRSKDQKDCMCKQIDAQIDIYIFRCEPTIKPLITSYSVRPPIFQSTFSRVDVAF